MSMCLQALGYAHADEDEVNKVMGALPMQGASWEQALACAQHYGCRATLTTPSTVRQLKEWTDRGVPVMIAWNPEGRDWSHASVVFDVSEDMQVSVADPNIPDPDETVRVLSSAEFYKTWYEKWPNYLVRRPACAIEREITPDGRQIMASRKLTANNLLQEVRKLKKMSSSSICEPNEIEYKDEADLESQVESAMESIFIGWGDVSTKIQQRSNSKVQITFQGTAVLDAHSPWWHRAGTKHSINFLGPHLAKLLGKGYEFEVYDDIPQILTPYFFSAYDDPEEGQWFLPFRNSKEIGNPSNNLFINNLSGHYEKDLKTIAEFIKKHTPRV